ncbi:MAG: hypothetical protein KDK55_05945 [Chlamydiia bacterium]|nr:hypothetical protein [Chlamydiia bacterium]
MSNKFIPLVVYSILTFANLFGEGDGSAAVQTTSVSSMTIAKKNQPSFVPFTGRVIGNKVRLRVSPSLESPVVREMHAGELFEVIAERDDFYIVVPSPEAKGYVFRTFILDNIVEADRVNVRLYPDIDSPVIGQLNAGQKVEATVSTINNKWMEIPLEKTAQFYVAKEYLENVGPIEMLAQREAHRSQAWHLLNSAYHLGQREIQKPFEEIDLEMVEKCFQKLIAEFSEFEDIIHKAQEITSLIQDAYIQKKISFLELKSDRTLSSAEEEAKICLNKLTQIGQELHLTQSAPAIESPLIYVKAPLIETSQETVVEVVSKITDKMLNWVPFEESLYHMWVASGGEGTLDTFYHEEILGATIVSGIIEPYNRPVKNRPGDYLLRTDHLPVAFLYSTKIDLQNKVGKKVTITVSPRPNNNFAFPAYFVHSIE